MTSKKYFITGKFLKGFTLLELIVVICIILIMATFGLPQFNKTIEKAKSAEAILILKAVRSAQLRYAAEREVTASLFEDLDVNHTALKYFDPVALTGNINVELDASTDIANITRQSNSLFGNYTLYINTNGNITCADGGEVAGSCADLGFTSK